jgi:hypothetical protein
MSINHANNVLFNHLYLYIHEISSYRKNIELVSFYGDAAVFFGVVVSATSHIFVESSPTQHYTTKALYNKKQISCTPNPERA